MMMQCYVQMCLLLLCVLLAFPSQGGISWRNTRRKKIKGPHILTAETESLKENDPPVQSKPKKYEHLQYRPNPSEPAEFRPKPKEPGQYRLNDNKLVQPIIQTQVGQSRPNNNEPVQYKPNENKSAQYRPNNNEHVQYRPNEKESAQYRLNQTRYPGPPFRPTHNRAGAPQYKPTPTRKRVTHSRHTETGTHQYRPHFSFTKTKFNDNYGGTHLNHFNTNHQEPLFAHSSGSQRRKGLSPKDVQEDKMHTSVVKKDNSIFTPPHQDRVGLMVQDPHASVYDIPTNEEVRAQNGSRDIIEDTVNKNLRRRAQHFQTRAKQRLADGHNIFLMAGPPYPGPNPRNPALALDKTVIYP